jgi:hypothetical protein
MMREMMNGMAGGGMMSGMGIVCLLILVLVGLGAAALAKYLFFSDKRK